MALFIGQFLGIVLGAALSAGIQKIILKYIFRLNPVFFPLLKVLVVLSVLIYYARLTLLFALGGPNILSVLIEIGGVFLIPAVISDRVKTVDGGIITYGKAFGAQLFLWLSIGLFGYLFLS